jgi:DNA-binding transcriptional LysR family regulator
MNDLRQIRYFLEIAAEGNMTRAAERLGITQPALSRQMAALEDRLGVELLERVGRGIRLTAAAEALVPELRDLLARAEGLGERAVALAGSQRVRLAMIAPPQSIEVFLADALGHFLERHPDADIRIIEAAAQQNQELLERGDAHLAIAARPIGGQFPSRDLARGFIHVAVPPGHRLAAKRRIDVGDLDGEPVLLMRRGTLVRDMFESACRLAHTTPRIAHEAGSPHALAALAGVGIGIAVLPFTARIEPKDLHITRLHAAGQPLSADLAAVWTPSLFITPAVDAFMRELQRSMHAAPFLEPIRAG